MSIYSSTFAFDRRTPYKRELSKYAYTFSSESIKILREDNLINFWNKTYMSKLSEKIVVMWSESIAEVFLLDKDILQQMTDMYFDSLPVIEEEKVETPPTQQSSKKWKKKIRKKIASITPSAIEKFGKIAV